MAETDANSLTYTHENLINGTTYTYAVKAFKNDNGNKEFSKESNLSDKLCDNNIIDFISLIEVKSMLSTEVRIHLLCQANIEIIVLH